MRLDIKTAGPDDSGGDFWHAERAGQAGIENTGYACFEEVSAFAINA
jgi:hypothetical protein